MIVCHWEFRTEFVFVWHVRFCSRSSLKLFSIPVCLFHASCQNQTECLICCWLLATEIFAGVCLLCSCWMIWRVIGSAFGLQKVLHSAPTFVGPSLTESSCSKKTKIESNDSHIFTVSVIDNCICFVHIEQCTNVQFIIFIFVSFTPVQFFC